MFFDLWSVVVLLISDTLELISSFSPVYTSSFSSISIPFFLFIVLFLSLCVLGWRTTFIPELPEVPRPPYVIQISSTPTLNNNGEHNSLADVRLLSSGVDVDNLRRSFPTLLVRERGGLSRGSGGSSGSGGSRSSNRSGADSTQNQASSGGAGVGGSGSTSNTTGNTGSGQSQTRSHIRVHQVRQQPGNNSSPNQQNQNVSSGTAILQGLLRPGSVIRPLIQRATGGGTGHVQNLIVYHRVNVYHHHHHHHHSENGQSTSEAPPELLSTSPNPNQDPQSSDNLNQPASADTIVPGSSASSTVPDPPSNRSSRSHSVDSSTQYEYVEPNLEDPSSETYEHLIDNPSSVNVLLGGVGVGSEATDGHGGSSSHGIEVTNNSSGNSCNNSAGNDNQNQPETEGLRLRRAVAFSDIRSGGGNTTAVVTDARGDSSVDATTTETANDAMDKSQTDETTPVSPTSATDMEINDIRFTIKFLNDTQMDVTTHAEEKVRDFKRRHFATELAENKKVRLIFNGRVLEDEASTGISGIFDQCVVHCLIVSRPAPPQPSGGSSSIGDANMGRSSQRARGGGILRGGTPEPGIFFVGFVGVFLIFLWFICFHFGQHLFTQSAVVSLTVLTAIFLVGLVAFYLPVHPANAA